MKEKIIILVSAFVINTNAQIITTIAGTGTFGYSGDGGQAIAAKLSYPSGITIDPMGNLYISDFGNSRIRKISTSGIITTIAGNGTGGYSGDGGQATNAELGTPYGLTFDTNGNLYIVDKSNYRVRMVNMTGIISTIAGNGINGYSGDGGQATAAELYLPTGITLDAVGNIYISDEQGNRIRKVNTSGIITTVVGNGTAGYSGDGGQGSTAEINTPFGITFDALGNLYIADASNNRIRMVNSLGIISTIVGNGTAGYSGDGGQATLAELNAPGQITFDVNGNLYIGEGNDSRIRKVNTNGIITTIAGIGTFGYSGDGGQATAAEINVPEGLIFDASGNLYIADSHNSRVRMVTNVGQAAGIEQFASSDEQVTVYPNPNNGSFVIETNTTTKQTMQVYDFTGKLVFTQTIDGKTNVGESSLDEGVYNISIICNNGVVNKRLVIVK